MRPPAPPRQPRRDPQRPSDPDRPAPEPAADPPRDGTTRGDDAGRRSGARTSGRTEVARREGDRTATTTDAEESTRPTSGRLLGRLRRETPPTATGAFAERLSERTRAERRLRSRTVLIVLACVAGLAALGWALLVSPLLALDPDQVEVTGTGEDTTVPTGDVLALVEQHAGTPLPRLDLEDLRGQVAALPTVFGAEVHRSWPRGLVVDVVARTPVAAIETDGRVELLDVEGVSVDVLDEVPEGMARVDVPRSGERAPQTLAAVLAVLAELPESIHAEVAVATAGGPASITLELTDGSEVRWGGAEESALKAAVLEVLREQPAAVYDVTVPRSPTTSE